MKKKCNFLLLIFFVLLSSNLYANQIFKDMQKMVEEVKKYAEKTRVLINKKDKKNVYKTYRESKKYVYQEIKKIKKKNSEMDKESLHLLLEYFGRYMFRYFSLITRSKKEEIIDLKKSLQLFIENLIHKKDKATTRLKKITILSKLFEQDGVWGPKEELAELEKRYSKNVWFQHPPGRVRNCKEVITELISAWKNLKKLKLTTKNWKMFANVIYQDDFFKYHYLFDFNPQLFISFCLSKTVEHPDKKSKSNQIKCPQIFENLVCKHHRNIERKLLKLNNLKIISDSDETLSEKFEKYYDKNHKLYLTILKRGKRIDKDQVERYSKMTGISDKRILPCRYGKIPNKSKIKFQCANKIKGENCKTHLIVISNDYSNSRYSGLIKTHQDAEIMKKLFKHQIKKQDVLHIKDKKYGDLMKMLDKYSSKIKSCDTVFLFYAGHGYRYRAYGGRTKTPKDRFFFVPPDTKARLKNGKFVIVKAPTIGEIIDKINAKKIVVVIDACYSGTAILDYLKWKEKHGSLSKSMTLFAATPPGMLAKESTKGPGSIFTLAFDMGVNNCADDVDCDGKISFDEIWLSALSKVADVAQTSVLHEDKSKDCYFQTDCHQTKKSGSICLDKKNKLSCSLKRINCSIDNTISTHFEGTSPIDNRDVFDQMERLYKKVGKIACGPQSKLVKETVMLTKGQKNEPNWIEKDTHQNLQSMAIASLAHNKLIPGLDKQIKDYNECLNNKCIDKPIPIDFTKLEQIKNTVIANQRNRIDKCLKRILHKRR